MPVIKFIGVIGVYVSSVYTDDVAYIAYNTYIGCSVDVYRELLTDVYIRVYTDGCGGMDARLRVGIRAHAGASICAEMRITVYVNG